MRITGRAPEGERPALSKRKARRGVRGEIDSEGSGKSRSDTQAFVSAMKWSSRIAQSLRDTGFPAYFSAFTAALSIAIPAL